MREQLLGYLLDALEPEERECLEDRLRRDPELQRELETLDEALEPLRIVDEPICPPPGLARRTCQTVAAYRAGNKSVSAAASCGVTPATFGTDAAAGFVSRRSLSDMIISAGVVVAATLLLLPAIQQSRAGAQLRQCQNNLRRIGLALANYCEHNRGYYPPVDGDETAGIYAVQLQEGGYLGGHGWNICPAAPHPGCQGDDLGHVPTFAELNSASGPDRRRLQRAMGGSYGYTLHYRDNGVYCCRRQESCPTLAIMADAPAGRLGGHRSTNHGRRGQNVLYDDGHVRCLCTCTAKGCRDHIFLNDDGRVAPGTGDGDAVIAPSGVSPFFHWAWLKTHSR